MKTEAYKLYSRVYWIFLPNFIKIAPCNFELYCFKVKTFFWDTVYGMSSDNLRKLQLTQNALARVVCQAVRACSATELCCTLHWLPVKQCIDYKLTVLTYKVRQSGSWLYLASFVSDCVPSCSLRSSDKLLVSHSYMALTYMANKAFSVNAPKIWNDLSLTAMLQLVWIVLNVIFNANFFHHVCRSLLITFAFHTFDSGFLAWTNWHITNWFCIYICCLVLYMYMGLWRFVSNSARRLKHGLVQSLARCLRGVPLTFCLARMTWNSPDGGSLLILRLQQ